MNAARIGAEIVGDGDVVGQRGVAVIAERDRIAVIGLFEKHGHILFTGRARPDRADLIAHAHAKLVASQAAAQPAQRQVAPEQALNRPDAGVLLDPFRVRLAFERHPGGEDAPLAFFVPDAVVKVNARDLKAVRVLDGAVDVPGNIADLVIAISPRPNDFGHGISPK